MYIRTFPNLLAEIRLYIYHFCAIIAQHTAFLCPQIQMNVLLGHTIVMWMLSVLILLTHINVHVKLGILEMELSVFAQVSQPWVMVESERAVFVRFVGSNTSYQRQKSWKRFGIGRWLEASGRWSVVLQSRSLELPRHRKYSVINDHCLKYLHCNDKITSRICVRDSSEKRSPRALPELSTRGRRPRALREGNARGLLFEDLESTTQLRINLELFQTIFPSCPRKETLTNTSPKSFFPVGKGKNCPS